VTNAQHRRGRTGPVLHACRCADCLCVRLDASAGRCPSCERGRHATARTGVREIRRRLNDRQLMRHIAKITAATRRPKATAA
jgi:hypothetical protein